MKKIFSIISITLFLLEITGCKHTEFDDKIARKVKAACKGDGLCTIEIKDVTEFQWDKMYVFKYNSSIEDITKAIGSSPGHYSEFTRKIFFTRGNRIVYSEEEDANVERLLNGEVVFDIPDSINYKVYPIERAKFKVEVKEYEKGIYYQLSQL